MQTGASIHDLGEDVDSSVLFEMDAQPIAPATPSATMYFVELDCKICQPMYAKQFGEKISTSLPREPW
jgi:hypothetical protein